MARLIQTDVWPRHMMMTKTLTALTLTGPQASIFELSDALGFESVFTALSISVFELSHNISYVQALYETAADAEAALSLLNLPAGVKHVIESLPDENWVSKSQEGLAPVTAGRFLIYGTHDAQNVKLQNMIGLQVDAGLAFGTGHHGTTAGCLVLFDRLISQDNNPEHILDLGCGAGVLAIAAAKIMRCRVLATDIDSDAVDVTLQNATLNNVKELIDAQRADGFDAPCFKDKTFDLMFANILAGPLMMLAGDITRHLSLGGHVILSGILREQEKTVADHFISHGLDVIDSYPQDEWVSLLARRSDATV